MAGIYRGIAVDIPCPGALASADRSTMTIDGRPGRSYASLMVVEPVDSRRRTHPGILLRQRFLDPLGIAPLDLARSIGVREWRISGLLNGRGRLTPDLALRLGLFFNVPARWWLDMQSEYDAGDAERLEFLQSVVRPFAGRERFFITPDGVQPLPDKAAPSEPTTLPLAPEFVARLRAQVAHNQARPAREPVVVYLADGRPMLTGRPA